MSIQVVRKLIDSPVTAGLDGAGVELRLEGTWVQWRQEDDNPTWANLYNLEDWRGADGLIGLPGENGKSVELQVYFGTIQWRLVGTEVWNHLINLSEITGAPGADGREIELLVEDGVIQWRYVGETELTPLIELADLTGAPGECECEDELPTPSNSAQTRCGASVRVTAALGEAYRRAKLDPDTWDALQTLANQVQSGGSAVVVAGEAAKYLFTGGAIISGLGLFGSFLLGAGTFFSSIFGLTNDNNDEFTPAREDAIQAGLYCVLTRQETASITADVLREWVHYIADAGFPAVDRDLILAILGWTPVSYWANEALVSSPEINPCNGLVCVAPDDPFAYEFSGTLLSGHPIDSPLAASLMTVVTGIRAENGLNAVAGFGNVRTFNITVKFGRFIPLNQIEAFVAYNQTANAVSPITISGAGFSATTTINGISEGTKRLYSVNSVSVKEFSISGQIATAGEFDADAELVLRSIKICGDGFPPFGVTQINSLGCTPPLCEELPMDGYTKMIDFCFRESAFGLVLNGMNQQAASYVPGEGFKTGRRIASSVVYREFTARWPRNWANQTLSGCKIRIEYSMALGTTFGGTGLYLVLRSASGVVTQISQDRTTANANQPVFFTVPANRNLGAGYLEISLKSGQRFNADPGGEAVLHRFTVYHNEETDPYTILPGDI